ncbi:MAG: tetratricopeptide repeat protein [Bryobacterales bacterium]|nr:tetratricopeptide repeat protein [Bryobacterales bacterium]
MAKRYTCLVCRNEIAHPNAECPYCKARSVIAEGASPRILGMVFGVMAAVFTVTGFYAKSFKAERSSRGQHHFAVAEELLAEDEQANAIKEYRNALSYAKEEPEYRLGLARALFEDERYAETENHLVDLRSQDPTSGILNYLLAQLAAKRGRLDAAVSYYRTAIHGRWDGDTEERRLSLRLELVDLLEASGRDEQLTAELIALGEIMPDDRGVQHKLGGLMLRSKLYDRASSLFQTLLETDPQDHEALLGRGEAEFRLGNYLTARTQYNRAKLLHDDAATNERIALCNRIIELDPTRRGISLRERFRRSRVLIDRTRAATLKCQNPSGDAFVGPLAALPAGLASALENADQSLAGRPGRATDEAVEANTLVAEELWKQAEPLCNESSPPDPPLMHVMAKLSR